MSRFNDGIVYANDACVGCNKCISVCPALGANVASSKDGKLSVNVTKKCIKCGSCITACEHGARKFRDDFELFMEDIHKGENISALIDPAFYVLYKEKAGRMLAFLRKLGINRIYDIAYGAEISMYYHAKYLKDNMDENHQCRQFIANTCTAISNFAECYDPDMLSHIIPVHNPTICTAIYAKKYLKDYSKYVVFTPCVTLADEIKTAESGKYVDYSVTFSSLVNYMDKIGLPDEESVSDLNTPDMGNLIAIHDGFIDGVSYFFPKEEVFTHYKAANDQNMKLLETAISRDDVTHSLMVTIGVCGGGCAIGSGVNKQDGVFENVMKNYRDIRSDCYNLIGSCNSREEFCEVYEKKYADLCEEDFRRHFQDRYRQPYVIPEDVINDIFESMHKDTTEKRHINCNSCGYRTCKNLAVAVANGYARTQSCVHYMNDDLKYQALVDHMTGIPNRDGFRARARKLLTDNPDKNYILMVGNINKLKLVNNLYGTEMGDKVISFIARRLEECIGEDGAYGRFGGGIVAAFMEDKPEITKPFMAMETVNVKHLGVFFPVTIRYGTYKVTDRTLRLSHLVNLCTYAADKASDRTKNTFIEYDESMRCEMQIETDITMQMRDAMNKKEFVLFPQPQYNPVTGKMVGAEALCRWKKSDGSLVSPGLFIPVFEKNGFVKELDKYVWESAFSLVEKWEKENAAIVPLSVNVSRLSLETDEIIETISDLSCRHRINKDNLYFEITESAYMKDQESLGIRVNRIRDLGYKIAMDDFGSGYSSLNSLKDIPVDIIKLDMGFLRGNTNVEKGNLIIEYVVDMAKKLNLKIIAEGVETKEQLDFLVKNGVDVIQGYYYSKPTTLCEFEEKVAVEI